VPLEIVCSFGLFNLVLQFTSYHLISFVQLVHRVIYRKLLFYSQFNYKTYLRQNLRNRGSTANFFRFYAVRVISNESRLLVLSRTSSFLL
jgi:hypothetical protein